MAMDAADITAMIKESLPDAVVTIDDLAGDGEHYAATVVSAAFKGKSRVQQHQMVYAALKGKMGGGLHALALRTGVRGAEFSHYRNLYYRAGLLYSGLHLDEDAPMSDNPAFAAIEKDIADNDVVLFM